MMFTKLTELSGQLAESDAKISQECDKLMEEWATATIVLKDQYFRLVITRTHQKDYHLLAGSDSLYLFDKNSWFAVEKETPLTKRHVVDSFPKFLERVENTIRNLVK